MYDEAHFTRDAAHVRFDSDAPGVTVDDDGDVSFDWDEVETVRIDDPPHATAFDSKEFYKLPATVAKPIPQPYQYGEDTVWLKKPREELKKAAWSLDNAPWTLGHPDTGMVKNVDDVRGFWKNPRYIDGADDLDADLHVPVKDEEAKKFLEKNGDVSVGFYNRISRADEYDGVVGGDDAEGIEIEGYQTDMLFDHCASVKVGRCPSGAGCGIDSQQHGHVDTVQEDAFISGTGTTHSSDDAEGTDSGMEETTDAPSGIHVADGKWFAVGPDEHPDKSTEYAEDAKFPVDSCSDVQDAWNLAGTGDISIEESTLRDRIQRAAEAQGCDLETDVGPAAVADSAKNYSICGSRIDVMDDRYGGSDGDCGCGEDTTDSNMEFEIDVDDMSAEAALQKVAEQHDGVAEHLDDLREQADAAETAQEAAEELELDSTEKLPQAVGTLKDERDSLKEYKQEQERDEMRDHAEFIAERTDRFGEDAEAVLEEHDDLDDIEDTRELVEELTEGYDEATANPGGDGGSSEETTDSSSGKYAKTPWE